MYLQNVLPEAENLSFEQHVLNCRHCQSQIEDEMNSLLALRRGAMARSHEYVAEGGSRGLAGMIFAH